MTHRTGRLRVAAAACGTAALLTALAGCGGDDGVGDSLVDGPSTSASAPSGPGSDASSLAGEAQSEADELGQDPSGHGSDESGAGRAPSEADRRVLVVSLDGFNPDAMTRLGEAGAPTLWRLHDEGAATLDARTAVEMTVTLPNHTGMVTGRRIAAGAGGHGVTFNEEVPGSTVQESAGEPVESIFSTVADDGGSTALFAGKDKFALFQRSWPAAIDRFEIEADVDTLVDDAVRDLTTADRRFTFLHLATPDAVGHAEGWMSPAYLDAVRHVDELLGEVVDAVEGDPDLRRDLAVVVTADHGGAPGAFDHGDATLPADYTVPFMVWGAGIERGDLYDLNPDYRDPGDARPTYAGPQPVRNADVADLSADLLGLDPVPGSQLDADFSLGVTTDDSTGAG